jgi:hypothetical protein
MLYYPKAINTARSLAKTKKTAVMRNMLQTGIYYQLPEAGKISISICFGISNITP